MKKIINLFALATIVLFSSCEENIETGDLNFISFQSTNETIVVELASSLNKEISVYTTTKSGAERVLDLNVTTSLANGTYTAPSTVTIPANSNVGTFSLSFTETNYDFVNGETMSITISDLTNFIAPAKIDFDISVLCNSALEGNYSVTTTYGYHDFLPSFSTNTTDVTITKVSDGVYSVEDFSGGLYSASGPYGINYSTSGFPVTFNYVCGLIQWTDQEDAWGATLPLAGGTNSVDLSTGVITISWDNQAYGENGVSVYTPK